MPDTQLNKSWELRKLVVVLNLLRIDIVLQVYVSIVVFISG